MGIKAYSKDGQKGQAAVEMALLLPVLILIFLAIMEVGRVLDAWLVATNAAREGARYAAVGEDAASVANRVSAYLTNGLGGRTDVIPPTAAEITVSIAGTPGNPVQVIVPLKVHLYSSWVNNFGLPDPIVVRGAATMRLQ